MRTKIIIESIVKLMGKNNSKEHALGFIGEDKRKKVFCNYDGKPIMVSLEMVVEEDLAHEKYRGRTLENGVYVSPIGAFYCNCKEFYDKLEEDEVRNS